MKKLFFALFLTWVIASPWTGVCADEFFNYPMFGSTPNPVGSGARAIGMGGAFIAVADDATAASWNPGGLIQLLEPEISVVGNLYERTDDIRLADSPVSNGEETVHKESLNYLSITRPFHFLNRNMVVSLSYQRLYDFTREWDFSVRSQDLTGAMLMTLNAEESFRETGSLSAIGIAYCIQIVKQLSMGITFNIWDDDFLDNSWKKKYSINGLVGMESLYPFPLNLGEYPLQHSLVDTYKFDGFNFNIGLLWRTPGNRLSVGLVFKSPFKGDIKQKTVEETNFDGFLENKSSTYNEELDMPPSYGLGISYKFTDSFKMALDIYHTKWEDFIYKESNGNRISPITGDLKNKSDIKSTTQVHMGMEYLFKNGKSYHVIPVRIGAFYDPEPGNGHPRDIYGVSAGTGFTFQRYVFDIAYQYRFGNDINSSMGDNDSLDIDEHQLYGSMIIYFDL